MVNYLILKLLKVYINILIMKKTCSGKVLPKFIPALDEQGNPVKAYVTIPLMFGTN